MPHDKGIIGEPDRADQDATLDPDGQANACVIWLHGLGASHQDFIPVVPHLKLSEPHGVRFVFPQAPSIPVTCNHGLVMPAWYDILALTEPREINLEHLQQTCERITALIDQQRAQGIEAERILLVGFSQGGAVAYHTALRYPHALGGLIALSTYLPNPETLAKPPYPDMPIRIAHGDQDNVVSPDASRQAHNWLIANGHRNSRRVSYPQMAHEVCLPEIRQIGQWIQQAIINA